ncbi:collagen-binding protein, peptidoglycan linked protein (LPXTG motif) [Streptococcus acidominimus]|uniref:Collagen-binding protein, peptidoglycan linked protein (LPXTG motif) n=1 Tax=Streptococcus acidominimus TaxID=1326 RepID=A0A239WEP5_STRAI|nr:Cna B-type domain-containing protein [Streptococcus acidominimus]SNV32398.1 collagen-binding protein, peptidoglycan linked protein (LPXTG motif) [Streptococcus acidominimus]
MINTYNPGKTSITVSKVWEDDNNKGGLRPKSIDVQLYTNGKKTGKVITLSADNKWTYTWTGLPLVIDDKEVAYSVSELSDVKGYKKTVSDIENGHVKIVNSFLPKPPVPSEKEKPKDKEPEIVENAKKVIKKVLPSTGETSSILGLLGLGLLLVLIYKWVKRQKG